ncbi:hypothetical protein AAY473_009556 [Plecturocebus cupreus]
MTSVDKDRFPTGKQAVPSMDPLWDPNSEQGDRSRRHLLTCILDGLRLHEGSAILKHKFIMQSAADISRRKLQKLALGPEQSLESLLNLATLESL